MSFLCDLQWFPDEMRRPLPSQGLKNLYSGALSMWTLLPKINWNYPERKFVELTRFEEICLRSNHYLDIFRVGQENNQFGSNPEFHDLSESVAVVVDVTENGWSFSDEFERVSENWNSRWTW